MEHNKKTPPTVLVVDDDHELRATITEILTPEGFTVVAAASADQALELLPQSRCELILLDMIMPGTDGLTAISLLRQLLPKVPIIIMTAYATVNNAVLAMQKGADDYITKPFRIEDLLATLRQHLAYATLDAAPVSEDSDLIFQGLANPLRRQIITLLHRQGRCRFMELVRALAVADHTKVNFHLKTLREAGFIDQDRDKNYRLTAAGTRAVKCLEIINKGI